MISGEQYQEWLNNLTPDERKAHDKRQAEIMNDFMRSVGIVEQLCKLSNSELADKLLHLGDDMDIFSYGAQLIDVVCDRLRGRPVGHSYLEDEDE